MWTLTSTFAALTACKPPCQCWPLRERNYFFNHLVFQTISTNLNISSPYQSSPELFVVRFYIPLPLVLPLCPSIFVSPICLIVLAALTCLSCLVCRSGSFFSTVIKSCYFHKLTQQPRHLCCSHCCLLPHLSFFTNTLLSFASFIRRKVSIKRKIQHNKYWRAKTIQSILLFWGITLKRGHGYKHFFHQFFTNKISTIF